MSRVKTTQYIKKPLYVDAVRITTANFDKVSEWCQGEVQQDEVPGKGTGKKYIRVRVHNPKNPRQTKAFVGDWLLYTERGYKVYTNKAFHASFDAVSTHESHEKRRSSDIIMGSDEIAPGLTLDELVAKLRDGRMSLPEATTEIAGSPNGKTSTPSIEAKAA
jgi:hypothetical protein